MLALLRYPLGMIERRRDPRRKPTPVNGQAATATIEPIFTDRFGRALPPLASRKRTPAVAGGSVSHDQDVGSFTTPQR